MKTPNYDPRYDEPSALATVVSAYSRTIGYPMDGEKWVAFYVVKQWRATDSNEHVTDWPTEVRLWKTNGWGQGTIALDASQAPEAPGGFLPVAPWTPESDREDEDADDFADTLTHKAPAAPSAPEIRPTTLPQAQALLALYRRLLTPVQLAHAAEQFEALTAVGDTTAPFRSATVPRAQGRRQVVRIPAIHVAAIIHSIEDRLQSQVVDRKLTGEALAREALATGDEDDIRHLIEPDAVLLRALLAADQPARGRKAR